MADLSENQVSVFVKLLNMYRKYRYIMLVIVVLVTSNGHLTPMKRRKYFIQLYIYKCVNCVNITLKYLICVFFASCTTPLMNRINVKVCFFHAVIVSINKIIILSKLMNWTVLYLTPVYMYGDHYRLWCCWRCILFCLWISVFIKRTQVLWQL